MIRRICVFCGSNSGSNADYAEAARSLGRLFAREGIALVYGGGSVGLMGELADAVLSSGGEAIGVIPHALWAREVGHRGLTDIRIVETMHERKAMMADLADAFIALPGGLGTLEEIFEIWTWAQLGLHQKPLGFLDVEWLLRAAHGLHRPRATGEVREGRPPRHRHDRQRRRGPAATLRRLATATRAEVDHAR